MAGKGQKRLASRLGRQDRFEVKQKLGAGAMGAVYRAYDRDRRIEVAVKSLLRADPRGLYRFKREFRSLADVLHPNLVSLFELHTAGDEWFFTMELVEGVPFTSHVRPYAAPVSEAIASSTTEPGETKPTGVWRRPPSDRERIRRGTLDVGRLSRALAQLSDGVATMHRAGKLHRDLKPSNVLVDRGGRVVVLDFGLAADKVSGGQDGTHDMTAVGTPMYMSPEQAADVPLNEATDWYSIGVMTYEALTGYRPFEDEREDVYLAKQLRDPRPLSQYGVEIPADLGALCMRLLDRNPDTRATGDDIQRVVQAGGERRTLARPSRRTPFVGRQAELDVLRHALEESRDGPRGVLVSGASGIGKSYLLRRFLAEVQASTDAVILEGRCYEREFVPHKALDAVVDSLTRHLLVMPTADLQRCLPREVSALSRLFPVLRRVPSIAEPALRRFEATDPQELRRQAFGALRFLLGRLADERPVVLYIDDLQWGGVDSATFLLDLLVHPSAPHMLLLLSYRLEDEASPLVGELRQRLDREQSGNATRLTLPAFDLDEARALTLELGADAGAPHLDALLLESGGSPLFLAEILRGAEAVPTGAGPRTLDDYLHRRVSKLSEELRAVLRIVAIATRPMPPEVVLDAAGLQDISTDLLGNLRHERLLRSTVADDGVVRISPYHDRVRSVTLAEMTADERAAAHMALANVLEDHDEATSDMLVEHWLGAGRQERAAHWALIAAAAAAETLEFHRAADFYALGLANTPVDDESRPDWTRYANALACSGRLDGAADAYARAAEGADADERLELGRHELQQLLLRGDLERGMERARDVLGAVGLRLPHTRTGALASIAMQRLLLRARGGRFRVEEGAEGSPSEVRRLEVCWSAASAISFVNPLLGRALQLKFMRLALSLGTRHHIAKAIGLELGYQGAMGSKHYARIEELYARGRALAAPTENPRLIGTIEASSGFAGFLCGRFPLALERIRGGSARLVGERDARWESDICQIMETSALAYLGRIGDLARLVPIYLREANERGDVYLERGLKGWRSNVLWLLLDQPETALANAEAEATGEFHLHHYYSLLAHCQHDLYVDDPERAWRRIEQWWQPLQKSLLMRVESVRIEATALYGRVALAASMVGEAVPRRVAADRAVRSLSRELAPWAHGLAQLLRGSLQLVRGNDDAVGTLRAALAVFEESSMGLYAAVTRHTLGGLTGGDEGSALRLESESWMHAQSVAQPARVANMLAPGFGYEAGSG